MIPDFAYYYRFRPISCENNGRTWAVILDLFPNLTLTISVTLFGIRMVGDASEYIKEWLGKYLATARLELKPGNEAVIWYESKELINFNQEMIREGYAEAKG